MSVAILLKAMRLLLQGVPLVFGSTSIFMLWASFYNGCGGSYAFVALAAATAIALGLGKEPA